MRIGTSQKLFDLRASHQSLFRAAIIAQNGWNPKYLNI
jgi:hypothetical protein